MSTQEPLHCINRALRLLGTIQHQLSKLVWSWYFNQVHYFSASRQVRPKVPYKQRKCTRNKNTPQKIRRDRTRRGSGMKPAVPQPPAGSPTRQVYLPKSSRKSVYSVLVNATQLLLHTHNIFVTVQLNYLRWLAPQLGVNQFLDVKKVFWPEEAHVTSKMLRHLTCPVEVRAGLGATEAHKENLVTLLKMFYKPFRPSSTIKGNGNGYNRV
ncbi:hypothetical protein DFH08DRAFT_1028989 [Mycena albidolilacea]|uniref:Uncharacterized protein n=1 Tax=Mycena albidolilacea TaxID=1033008 RepID=A0AAD6ZIN8_9AGAR|nr:hypothetical protein DFH08DRAFT_1028989 [Mycena albidolilacea]